MKITQKDRTALNEVKIGLSIIRQSIRLGTPGEWQYKQTVLNTVSSLTSGKINRLIKLGLVSVKSDNLGSGDLIKLT